MITQLPFSQRSISQASSSSISNAKEIVFSLTEPTAYLKKLAQEDDDYQSLRNLEEAVFEVKSLQRRLRIEENSLKSEKDIQKLEAESKLRSFEALESLSVQRLKEYFLREEKQANNFLYAIEEQLKLEKEQFRNVKIQGEGMSFKVDRINMDIGNF